MVVTITSDFTDVSMCDATTGWAGGIEQFVAETGVKVEGSASLCAWIDATTSDDEYYAFTSADLSGQTIYLWMYCSGVVDTKTNGGYRITAYSGTDYTSEVATWYVGGNDTHPAGGWVLMAASVDTTPDAETGTFDPTDVIAIGVQFKTLTSAIKKGQTYVQNCFWDAVRYGTSSTVTSGATDGADYQDIYDDEINDNYFGVVQKAYGSYIQTGKVILGGTGTETCDFVIDNEIIIFPDNDRIEAGFHEILPLGNATNPTYVEITGSVIKSAGAEKFTLDASGANIDTVTLTGSTLNNSGDLTFASGQSITSNVFTGCDPIDPNLATFTGNTISSSTALGTSEGSLMINATGDATAATDLIFTDYVGATTYAVYVASGVTAITMDNWYFDDPDNTTSYALYWAGAAGTLTVSATNGTNLVSGGCTSAGGTVSVVSSVDLTLTVKDPDGAAIIGARCMIEAGDGTGAAPYLDSVVITSSGTVATVTHSGHALSDGQMVNIRGCNQPEYNGAGKIITYISSTQYSYVIAGTPASPATGSPTSTQCMMSETSTTGGIATQSFATAGTQPYSGKVRYTGGSVYYADVTLSGTDCSGGLDLPVQMGLDE